MSELKHTPGPWFIHDSTSHDRIYDRSVGTFDIRTNAEGVADNKSVWIADVKPYEGKGFTGKEVAQANAKLIAAAPDLLKVAVEALDFICAHNHYVAADIITKLQTTIAKATT